jgi:hypothetical protein
MGFALAQVSAHSAFQSCSRHAERGKGQGW